MSQPSQSLKRIHNILNDVALWPETLQSDITYERVHDDCDGVHDGIIRLQFDRQGDAWLQTVYLTKPHLPLRFRTWGGGGMSLRVRNALIVLAEAIRMDNKDRTQTGLEAPDPADVAAHSRNMQNGA